MKLSTSSRFPRPILSPDTLDYRDAAFEMEVACSEDYVSGRLTLICKPAVRCPSIEELMRQGLVGLALSVGCRDTYYKEVHELAAPHEINLPLDEFFGRVDLTPLLIASDDIASHSSTDISAEFLQPVAFHRGDLVGYAPTMFISVGRLKLEKFDSIFQLSEADDLEAGEVAVDLDAEKIQIQVSPGMKEQVDGLRMNTKGQRVLLSTLYLPAVMEVLSILAADSGAGGGRRWKEVFLAKCDRLKINPEKSGALLRDAQRLLHFPVPVSLAASEED